MALPQKLKVSSGGEISLTLLKVSRTGLLRFGESACSLLKPQPTSSDAQGKSKNKM